LKFYIKYGSGDKYNILFKYGAYGGFWSLDTVNVAGLNVKNQVFGEVVYQSDFSSKELGQVKHK
jgi:hypothetical protein